MNEQARQAADPTEEPHRGAVSLIIDFSNGGLKIFSSIPWVHNMAVLDLLEQARSARPDLQFEFSSTRVDRANRNVGAIALIDGVAPESENQAWMFWVNRGPAMQEIRSRGMTFGLPTVEAGDVVTFKLVTTR